ncbi:glycosyltransferase family 2 protein [Endozoicomonas ascidiicola]|uniref:glycosyltransferase family 2 protein n=1 Tax=Endozoicomonas ascidiicola TaxID=1698521 RepID=UPI00082B0AA5|nr:glycosyltransferase family A protein [Endozoicomonas ascidiicola]
MKNSEKMFSVVVPCYNYADYVERAALSVLNQTCSDYELIIINDGSTDHSREVLSALEVKFPAIRVIHNENQGLAATRNCGIRAASGRFLIFLDADDYFLPDALENFKRHHQLHPEDKMIIGGHQSVHGVTNLAKVSEHLPKVLPNSKPERFKAYLIDKAIGISNGATAMHKSVFDKYQYPEQFRNSEDIPVFAYVLANFDCGVLQKAVTAIYKHSDSLRHNTDYANSIGTMVVDEVFNAERIDKALFVYKNKFYSQRCLSLFRTLISAGNKDEAYNYYRLALCHNWMSVFKLSYTSKFIRSILK